MGGKNHGGGLGGARARRERAHPRSIRSSAAASLAPTATTAAGPASAAAAAAAAAAVAAASSSSLWAPADPTEALVWSYWVAADAVAATPAARLFGKPALPPSAVAAAEAAAAAGGGGAWHQQQPASSTTATAATVTATTAARGEGGGLWSLLWPSNSPSGSTSTMAAYSSTSPDNMSSLPLGARLHTFATAAALSLGLLPRPPASLSDPAAPRALPPHAAAARASAVAQAAVWRAMRRQPMRADFAAIDQDAVRFSSHVICPSFLFLFVFTTFFSHFLFCISLFRFV